ncbi:MAG: Uma2 family endonuclease [Proteobacteria bacterium]|nr:Uma2 family endonuclease [Pseudomonadota bacterium]
MAQLAHRPHRTFAQYLELEASSSTKHALFEGDIFETTVLNPTVIVEVLSEGTARNDRGDKLEHFKQIPALQAWVFVAHDDPRIEVHQRIGSTWLYAQWRAGEAARIDAIACLLEVSEIFA